MGGAAGKADDARRVLQKMSDVNGVKMPQEHLTLSPGGVHIQESGNLTDVHTAEQPSTVELATSFKHIGIQAHASVENMPENEAENSKLMVVEENGISELTTRPAETSPSGFLQLFTDPSVRCPMLLGTALWFFAQIGSGWYLWVVEIATREGLQEFAVNLMLVARVCVTLSFCLTSCLINHFKDTTLLMAYLIAVGVASVLFSVIVAHHPGELLFGGGFLLYAVFFAGTWPVMYVVTPVQLGLNINEIPCQVTPRYFPTTVRVTAFSIASAGSKLGSIVHPQIAGHLLDTSLLAAGLIYSSGWWAGCAAVFAVTFWPRYV